MPIFFLKAPVYPLNSVIIEEENLFSLLYEENGLCHRFILLKVLLLKKKISFLLSGRKAPTSWPLRETKLPLSGTVEQKNSIQTMASKNKSLRSHVCQPRLRLCRQLHVI